MGRTSAVRRTPERSLISRPPATRPEEVSTVMAKSQFVRTEPHLNIGTMGHVDHGKTP